MLVQMLEIFAPAQLKNKPMLHTQAVAVVHDAGDIGDTQKTVRQIRRQATDRTIQMISGVGIFTRIEQLKSIRGCARSGFKVVTHAVYCACIA